MLQRYTFARTLGDGAAARTHLAVQHGGAGLRRLVAIKELRRRADEDRVFRRMRLLAPLEHHHLARVVDQGVDSGRAMVVTEYVVGESLLSILALCVRAQQPAPVHIALRIVADACAGLHAAHTATDVPDLSRHGVVHGALRPSNLLVSYDGCTKVTDCGLTNIERLRREVEITPAQAHFMAPELLADGPVDGRADVYSAAVLLYTLLTLRYPYDAHRSVAEVMDSKGRQRIVAPSRRNRSVPAELDALLISSMASDPEQRPRSAASLRYELETSLIRHGRFATHMATADYLGSVYARRIKAKRSALDALLSLPPGQAVPEDTIVDVVDEVDRRAIDGMFVEPGRSATSSGDFPTWDEVDTETVPTTPEVDWRDEVDAGPFADDTDTDAGLITDDDDTAVG